MEYIKEVIEQLAGAVPEQTKANVNAKYKFEEDNKALFEAFKNIDIALRDKNGDCRNTYDVLCVIKNKLL